MAEGWQGAAELFIYRDNARIPVTLDLHRKPARPGMADRWAGSFAAEPFTVLTLGRGLITLPDGAEAEVMVEGFDVATGAGDFIGIDAAPF
jgi:hypothetical protein